MSPASRLFAVAAVAAVLFAALLWTVLPIGHPIAADVGVAEWVVAHRTETGISAFDAISAVGTTPSMLLIAIAVAVYLFGKGRWAAVGWFALGVGGAVLLYRGFNIGLGRPRPGFAMRLYEESSASFPSGHASQNAALWLMSTLLVMEGHTRRARIAAYVVGATIVVAIGLSRIYLCQHWTTDVCAGFALATAWIFAVLGARARVATSAVRSSSGPSPHRGSASPA